MKRTRQNRARDLRNTMTKAEACLWKYALRSTQRGYTFRKQHCLGTYIVDFYVPQLNFIIEVDGASHELEGIGRYDRQRQRDLEQEGYHILRFRDEEVLENMESVIQSIDSEIASLEKFY